MNEDTQPDQDEALTPLQDALAFIAEQEGTYTDETLRQALIDSGYPYLIVDEAMRLHDEGREPEMAEPITSSGRDQRGPVAIIILGFAIVAWVAAALLLGSRDPEAMYDFSSIGLVILALVLGLALMIGLVLVSGAGSLKRGAPRAMATALVAFGAIYFGLAGTCVMIMSGA